LVLDQFWSNHRLTAYGLAMLSKTSYHTCKFASSQLEWMNEKVIRAFDQGRENLFTLPNVKLCHTLQDLDELPTPRVVLATSPTLSYGFSRLLFAEWCGNPKNRIIFTDRKSQSGSMMQRLLSHSASAVHHHVSLKMSQRVPLQGEELRKYRLEKALRAKALEEERQSAAQAALEEEPDMELGDGNDDMEDVIKEQELELVLEEKANPYFTTSYDLFATDVTESQPFPMFPHVEEPAQWDEYGEALPANFLSADKGAGQQEWISEDNMRRRAEKLRAQKTTGGTEAGAEEVPTKCVVRTRALEIRCQVSYVDFEGRSDARSVKNILSQLTPRKYIVLHGETAELRHLVEHLRRNARNCEGIFCPNPGEVVNIAAENRIYQMRFEESLWKSLDFISIPPYEIAYLKGSVEMPRIDEHGNRVGVLPTEPTELANYPRLCHPRQGQRAAVPSAPGGVAEGGITGEGATTGDEAMVDVTTEGGDGDRLDGENAGEDGWGGSQDMGELYDQMQTRHPHLPTFIGEVVLRLADCLSLPFSLPGTEALRELTPHLFSSSVAKTSHHPGNGLQARTQTSPPWRTAYLRWWNQSSPPGEPHGNEQQYTALGCGRTSF